MSKDEVDKSVLKLEETSPQMGGGDYNTERYLIFVQQYY